MATSSSAIQPSNSRRVMRVSISAITVGVAKDGGFRLREVHLGALDGLVQAIAEVLFDEVKQGHSFALDGLSTRRFEHVQRLAATQ